MVDGVLLDKLDYIARDLRDCDIPFGGIQVSHVYLRLLCRAQDFSVDFFRRLLSTSTCPGPTWECNLLCL